MNFLSLLAILFIGLKLTGYIAWSWWLVTLPLWFGIAIMLFVVIAALGTAGIAKLWEVLKTRSWLK